MDWVFKLNPTPHSSLPSSHPSSSFSAQFYMQKDYNPSNQSLFLNVDGVRMVKLGGLVAFLINISSAGP